MESLTKIKTGNLYSLSVQQLVDCVTQSSNTRGCDGGNQNDAFDYLIQNGGITTESNYPYKAKQGNCNADRASQIAAQISGYEYVPENDEDALWALEEPDDGVLHSHSISSFSPNPRITPREKAL